MSLISKMIVWLDKLATFILFLKRINLMRIDNEHIRDDRLPNIVKQIYDFNYIITQ